MSKQSIEMLGDTEIELVVVGDKIRADGFFGQKDGLHSVAWSLEDFSGRIFIDASLETDPQENDWFSIFLDGSKPYIEYPLIPALPSGRNGDTTVDAFTFQGNFLWLRVRMDKSNIRPVATTDTEKSLLGSINRLKANGK